MSIGKYMKNVVTGTIVPVPDDQTYLHLQAQRLGNEPLWEDATTAQAEAAGLLTDEGSTLALAVVAPAVAVAGNDSSSELGTVEVAGTVTKVEFFPNTNQNGADTNSRTLTVVNNDGNKTVASLALTNGVNLTAAQSKALGLGSGANIQVAEGDSLTFHSTHVGTGITGPGGLVVVTYEAS